MKLTTDKDFAIFVSEAEKWIERFGLVDWLITFEHKKLERSHNCAELESNVVNRFAHLRLNIEYPWDNFAEVDIRRDAFHEVCELLLCRLEAIGDTRIIGPDELREAVHEVIRILENAVWERESLVSVKQISNEPIPPSR